MKTRRDFLKEAGVLAAAGVVLPAFTGYHVAENNTIQVALVGCGGRGTGAAVDAMSIKSVPIKVVAMADVFERRVTGSHASLTKENAAQMDVPPERRFVGFDAYKKAMDCLKPGDLVILATPPAFRWPHYAYAIQKGLHVFMEKPVTVDAPTSKRMLALNEQARAKNLKVGVGLMVRHCRGRRELYQRVRDGQMGDIVMLRAYRMHGAAGSAFAQPRPQDKTDLQYQIERFHSFLWASGGLFSDFYIHQIDECCWMKDAWPVEAQASGGRHYRGDSVDQNFDNYSVEYTYPDGTKLLLYGRTIDNAHQQMSSYAHGTKGSAIISFNGHAPGKVALFNHQDVTRPDPVWAFPQPEPNPYRMEWVDLVDAIIKDEPYNEVERGVKASLVTSMGRMAAHTGRVVTLKEMEACPHEFAPGVADFETFASTAPVVADASGKYPIPEPGVKVDREY